MDAVPIEPPYMCINSHLCVKCSRIYAVLTEPPYM